MLLAKEETVLQGMNGRLTEIGKFYEMEMNGEKRNVMRITRQSSIVQIMIDQKTAEECGIFQLFGWRDNKSCKMYTWNYIYEC